MSADCVKVIIIYRIGREDTATTDETYLTKKQKKKRLNS